MYMDWEDLYSKEEQHSKSSLQIQCNFHQIFKRFCLKQVLKGKYSALFATTLKKRVIMAVIFPNNKRTAGSNTISDIKVFYRAIEIKIAWC